MITLNLETKNEAQKRLKEFLEQNASESLADKINNGVYIEKDGKRLLNKKNLACFVKYATEQAKEQAAKGETGAFVEDNTVFSWLIHYFEEDDIIGTLYNQDGSEYKAPKPVATNTFLKPVIKEQPKPQLSIFDMMMEENKGNSKNSLPTTTEESAGKVITPAISAIQSQKQPSRFYQTYLQLVEKHEGFLILLRLGDFYEAINDHATTLASELNLTLTGKDCGLDERVPMVGIPCHAIDNYVNKLIEHDYKVILAEDSDNVLEFKNLEEYEEPENLSEEEMQKFDNYVDEDSDELPTVSKIVGTTDDDDEDCSEILNAECAKAFDKEALCIISDLFNGEITLA